MSTPLLVCTAYGTSAVALLLGFTLIASELVDWLATLGAAKTTGIVPDT